MGETVDLGIDLGLGPYGVEAVSVGMSIKENGDWVSETSFRADKCHFHAERAGLFDVKIYTYNYSDTVMIEVYDNAACADIELPEGVGFVGTTRKIILRDAAGNDIFRPAEFTGNVECYAEKGYWYVTPAEGGEFTMTVTNPDGSRVSKTFKVAPAKPSNMTLNATQVTMKIGERFALTPTFNVPGDFVCEYVVNALNSDDDYGIACVRVEDGTIIAQGPGEGRVYVRCGDLSRTCYVTVEESDEQISLVYSEYPVGVGHTLQVTVQDKTGKVYPAVFSVTLGGATITPDGELRVKDKYSFEIRAELEDGRVMTSGYIHPVVYPKWLEYKDIFMTMGNEVSKGVITTDQGQIDWDEVILTIEDPSVAMASGSDFWPQKPGVTTATITSKYTGVSCTFQIEVVDERLYIGSANIHVPYGFIAPLPVVTNASGKEVSVKWKIIQNNPGEGNPEDSAFLLEGNNITCIWPDGSCILTGTASNGSTVRVSVQAYYLPDSLTITPQVINLEYGETARVYVSWDDPYAQVKNVYWIADTEGVIYYHDNSIYMENVVKGIGDGTVYLMAMLDNGAYGICQVNVHNPYARLPGDANEDGVVDARDALLVMQYAAGWNLSINGYAADVNADSKVTVDDAVLIFQHDSGLDVELKQYIPAP